VSDPVLYRAAEAGDAEAVLAAFAWLFAPPAQRPELWDEARARQTVLRIIEAPTSEVMIAESETRLVGFCTVALDLFSIRFGPRAWVEDLAVDPQMRSRGIGAQLLALAQRWGKAQGATHLELDSAESRLDAHRFYRRHQPSWESRCFGWQL
jgi:GNAT superfamily N-acetyltransferase